VNPDPAVVLAILAVSLVSAIVLIATAFVLARVVAPRLEGWCARRNSRLFALLSLAEDAALPWDAKQRARRLFSNALDGKQRRAWSLRRQFTVRAASGRAYTFSRYRPFNIRSGEALFCLQVHGSIPVYDKLLAQKLLVEADEQRFLSQANVRTFSPAIMAEVTAARRRACSS
jgi:hypothetical protein